VPPESIAAAQRAEDSRSIAGRVHAARLLQLQRQGRSNARIEGADVLALSRADDCALEFLGRAMRGLALSARAYHRVLRVARTIADLAGSDEVRTVHVSEAVQLRQLDRRSPSMGATSISR
jgi:magnesium chelatase family protein